MFSPFSGECRSASLSGGKDEDRRRFVKKKMLLLARKKRSSSERGGTQPRIRTSYLSGNHLSSRAKRGKPSKRGGKNLSHSKAARKGGKYILSMRKGAEESDSLIKVAIVKRFLGGGGFWGVVFLCFEEVENAENFSRDKELSSGGKSFIEEGSERRKGGKTSTQRKRRKRAFPFRRQRREKIFSSPYKGKREELERFGFSPERKGEKRNGNCIAYGRREERPTAEKKKALAVLGPEGREKKIGLVSCAKGKRREGGDNGKKLARHSGPRGERERGSFPRKEKKEKKKGDTRERPKKKSAAFQKKKKLRRISRGWGLQKSGSFRRAGEREGIFI